MLYIVAVKEDGEVYEYEYGNVEHAVQHAKEERSKGNEIRVYSYAGGEQLDITREALAR